jgi:hypothetical protein
MKTVNRNSSGLTFLEILVVVVVIALLAAVLLPNVTICRRRSKVAGCRNNLSQLWKMENIYMSKYGCRPKLMPTETGGAFWLKLGQVGLIDPSVFDIYSCPAKPRLCAAGTTHYRGPTGNVNALTVDDPVGGDGDMDSAPNEAHPGEGKSGHVVLKSGDVLEYAGADWEQYDLRITY